MQRRMCYKDGVNLCETSEESKISDETVDAIVEELCKRKLTVSKAINILERVHNRIKNNTIICQTCYPP